MNLGEHVLQIQVVSAPSGPHHILVLGKYGTRVAWLSLSVHVNTVSRGKESVLPHSWGSCAIHKEIGL